MFVALNYTTIHTINFDNKHHHKNNFQFEINARTPARSVKKKKKIQDKSKLE